ncbi:MAG: EAL domain-containing protein, partial [Pseudomonadota bacterium]
VRQDGSDFEAQVWGVLITINDRPADLVTLHDVSQTNRMLRDLRERTQRLVEAEQLGSMGSGSLDLSTGEVTLSEGLFQLFGEPSTPHPVSVAWVLSRIPQADHDLLRSIYGTGCIGPAREATHRIECADGRVRIVLHRGVVESDEHGHAKCFRWVVQDISGKRQAEQQAYRLAHFDSVTRLPNRKSLRSRLDERVRLVLSQGRMQALCVLEIDQLALVSETMGYVQSEALLKAVAERLSTAQTGIDTLAHLGRGEYAVLFDEAFAGSESSMVSAAQALMHTLVEPFDLSGTEVFVSCQVGITVFPQDGTDPDQLLMQGQSAIRQGRHLGQRPIMFFSPQADERIAHRLNMEAGLRRALERQEFYLHYQPQLSLSTGRIIGVEALLRWTDAKLGEILPVDFIPVAEATGLILPIGTWVLRTACLQARAWQQAGLPIQRMAVNLSALQLQQSDIVQHVEAILLETGLDPRLLSLEVTEGMLLENVDHVVRALTELKAIGIEIALDDFGTGYSSLSYLRTLPIDVVKVDRSFVNDVTASPQNVSLTRAIINMAHSLQMKVLAEGVENEGQLALLIANHCDQFQGFYFSEAVASSVIETMLREGRQLPDPLLTRKTCKRTLLLVDDEENIVASLRRLLRRDGYHIVVAYSGAEGLQRLAEQEVDVIVSDQRMPGMTGVEFLRRAKELYPGTMRIVLSGYTELQSITDAINEGSIYKFLTKPWDDER